VLPSYFQVGNKRLKVQHKQIRPKDLHNDRDEDDGGFGGQPVGGTFPQFHPSSLPPSGPMANHHLWYDGSKAQETHNLIKEGVLDEGTEITTASTGAGSSLQYNSGDSGGLASMGSLQSALPDIGGLDSVKNSNVPE
jgi:hypothetical protein